MTPMNNLQPITSLQKEYIVTYKETLTSPIKTKKIMAYWKYWARLQIKYENPITHNQIQFYE